MRFVAPALLLGLAGAAIPGTAPAAARGAEPDTYIFDVLALQPYKGNFARLVKDAAVPDWVKAISAQGAGAAGPSRSVDVGGTPYRLDRVCKVGASCASDRIDVLWAPRGARVWAALVDGGQAPVMLGGPKGAQAEALNAAGEPASAPASAAAAVAPAPSAPASAEPAAAPASRSPPSPQAPPARPAAETDPYIFDVLPLQPYKGNFARLVKAKDLPGWVHAIAAQGAGAAGPSRTVDVGGTPYRLDRVCKVGASCASDRIDVLWAPRGARVWAALVDGGKAPVLLGDPKGAQARALNAAGEPASGPAGAAAVPAPAALAPNAPVPAEPAAAIASATPRGAPSPQASPAQLAAETDPYIFDVLPLQPYKGNFARLVKAKDLPGWVHAIAAQGAGAAGPSRTVDVGGTPYRLDRVCKVGASCASDRIDVLWAPRGARVWGALVAEGKPPVMLGDPKAAQAQALAAAVAPR